jgi:tetratricopeptide (TPR) repeat protein
MNHSAFAFFAGIIDFLDARSAEELGAMMARLLMGAALLFGIVKCLMLMRRQTTSSLCVLPLLCFLLILASGAVLSGVRRSTGIDPSVLGPLIGLVVIFLLIAGIICGIVGLATYGSIVGKYVQGRSQAIWGLILNGLIMLLIFASIIMGLGKSGAFGNGFRTSSGREYQDADHTFSIRVPENGWTELDPKRMGGQVHLALVKSKELISLVVSSDVGMGSRPVDLDAAVSDWKARIRSKNEFITIPDGDRQVVQGKEFFHFTFSSFNPKLGKTLAYDCWVTIQAGNRYEFMTYGPKTDQTKIEAYGRHVTDSFRRLGSVATTSISNAPFRDAFYHPWGFSTHLADLGWKNWPGEDGDFKSAVFTAFHNKDSYFGIVPLPMQSTSIDMPTAASALLVANSGLSWSKDLTSRKSIRVPGADEAIQASADVERNGIPIHYELRVIRQGKRYLLLLAWANSRVQKDTRFLIQALDAVSIHPQEKLPDLTKSTSDSRQNMGLCLHQCGLAAYSRKEYVQSANLFQESLALSLSNPKTLINAVYALRAAGQPHAALDLLKSYDGLFPDEAELSFLRGVLEVMNGEPDGHQRLMDLFKSGYRDDDALSSTVELLLDGARAKDALELTTRYLEGGASVRAKRLQALACSGVGDDSRAMDILTKLMDEEPFDVETGYQYGETANKAHDADKASAMAERLIKQGYDGPRARMILGWAHASRQEWRQAKECFESAAKAAPNEASITDAIARASAFLGEGDNSSLKNPIPALGIPSSLKSQLQKAAEIPAEEQAGALFLNRVTVYQFQKNQPLVTTIYQDFKLLDSGAIADYSTLVFPFDPLSEEIYVNSLVVTNPDGSEAARVKPEEQYVVDESSSSAMASQRKQLRIAVPGLKEKRTIHAVVTTRSKSVDAEFPWLRKPLFSTNPVNLEAVVVMADPKLYKVFGNEEFKKRAIITRNGEVWQSVISPLPRLYAEGSMPSVETFLPVLSLADSKADWASISKKYAGDLEECLKPEASVTARASQITDSCKTRKEKIQALARFVQKEITYQGLEFGKRARQPNSASRVLACHYGDCKDQALLLHQMLKAVDIPSDLALVSTDYELVEDLPSLDQFNHMIVHVPELPCRFIDTTGPYNPVGEFPPLYASKKALVLAPDKARIISFPEMSLFPPDEVKIDRTVDFEKSGSTAVNENLSVKGYYASSLRAYFSGQTQEQKLASYQAIMRTKASLQMDELEIRGMEDVGGPLFFTYRYTLPASAGAKRLPTLMEEVILGATYGKSRHHPFTQFHDQVLESSTKLNPSVVMKNQDFNRSGHDEFLQWEMKSGDHEVTFKSTRLHGVHPPSDYNAFYESAQKAISVLETPLK